MIFEQNNKFEKLGEKIGFFGAYLIFTTGLFLILTLFEKMPANWNYLHIIAITTVITFLGMGIKRLLK